MNLPTIKDAKLPDTYEAAKLALGQCQKVDECKDWSDKAEALASYGRQANDDQLLKLATRIKARAIKRAGEILNEIEPARGERTDLLGASVGPKSRKQVAKDAGLSLRQQKTAQRVANVPDEEFEKQVESDDPPTITKLAEQGTTRKPFDLGGRDKDEFNKALHFAALIERYVKALSAVDFEFTLSCVINSEADEIRADIATIDQLHSEITRGLPSEN